VANTPLQQTKPRTILCALRYHACGFAAERQVVSQQPSLLVIVSSAATIRSRAAAFRRALEMIPLEDRGVSLAEFPHGACSDASDLLGTYLSERRLGEFEYVSGDRQYPGDPTRRSSHAWLEQRGLIIDITADQFEEIDDSVLVIRNSAWHCSWTPTHRRVANFRATGSFAIGTLERVYKAAVIRADAG
jgi:hypothetical protein